MKQQINLYEHLPQTKWQFKATVKNILLVYAVFIFFHICSYVMDVWQKHKQVAQLAQITTQLNQEQQHLVALAAQYPALNMNDLGNSIGQLKKQFAMRAKLAAMLANRTHFSDYLIGIAKNTTASVWLSQIKILRSDQSIEVHGFALQAPAIQKFLDSVDRDPAFSDSILMLQELAKTSVSGKTPYEYFSFSAMNKEAAPV